MVRDHKKGQHRTLHHFLSTFRYYTHSEPRFRAVLTESGAEQLESARA
jgi:hypothetical protein